MDAIAIHVHCHQLVEELKSCHEIDAIYNITHNLPNIGIWEHASISISVQFPIAN